MVAFVQSVFEPFIYYHNQIPVWESRWYLWPGHRHSDQSEIISIPFMERACNAGMNKREYTIYIYNKPMRTSVMRCNHGTILYKLWGEAFLLSSIRPFALRCQHHQQHPTRSLFHILFHFFFFRFAVDKTIFEELDTSSYQYGFDGVNVEYSHGQATTPHRPSPYKRARHVGNWKINSLSLLIIVKPWCFCLIQLWNEQSSSVWAHKNSLVSPGQPDQPKEKTLYIYIYEETKKT